MSSAPSDGDMVEFGGISMAGADDGVDGAISAAAADPTVSVDAITATVSCSTVGVIDGSGDRTMFPALHTNVQQ